MNDIYGVILAGGQGMRMGNIEKPKQFLDIDGKPIIIHTIEKFILFSEFSSILVLVSKPWIQHTKDLIKKYIPDDNRLIVTEGGQSRNDTIMNSIQYIDEAFKLTDETVIVTHDSVRPFVTYRIIEENIRYAKEYGACDTVIKATDTIVESKDGKVVSTIPDRRTMYQGQTPQSFKAKLLKELYNSLTAEEKKTLTDACKIMSIKGEPVYLIKGEVYNIKITYPYDIKVSELLLVNKD